MRNVVLFGFLAVMGVCTTACDNEGTLCTDDFRSVSITVNGGTLDDTYTIRNATNDTLRFTQGDFGDEVYIVVDDSMQGPLEGNEETFTFVGIVEGAVVVEELFVVGADECHIYKVSGPEEVSL